MTGTVQPRSAFESLAASFAGGRAFIVFVVASLVVVWGELSPRVEIAVPWDKGFHLLAYGVLASLVVLFLGAERRTPIAMAGLIGAGAILEFVQRWTGRDPSVADAMFNAIGVMAGWILTAKVSLRQAEPYYFMLPAAGGGPDAFVLIRRCDLPDDAANKLERHLAQTQPDTRLNNDCVATIAEAGAASSYGPRERK